MNGNFLKILGLDFWFVDSMFFPTMFWPYKGGYHDIYKRLHVGFHAECLHEWYGQRNGLPLPFRCGDLVRLDPPIFWKMPITLSELLDQEPPVANSPEN